MIEYNAILKYLNFKMDLVPRGWLAIGAAFAIGGDAGKKQIATRLSQAKDEKKHLENGLLVNIKEKNALAFSRGVKISAYDACLWIQETKLALLFQSKNRAG